MAKSKGGQRVIRIKRRIITPAPAVPANAGPFPKEWYAEPINKELLTPSPQLKDQAWNELTWMLSPEGELLKTKAVTGNSPEHSDAARVLMRRAGQPYTPHMIGWGGLEKALEQGWSSVRWWVFPNRQPPFGWLHIREAGPQTTKTLRRLQNTLSKLADMGLPLNQFRNEPMLTFELDLGSSRTGITWKGTFSDFMAADSWRDIP